MGIKRCVCGEWISTDVGRECRHCGAVTPRPQREDSDPVKRFLNIFQNASTDASSEPRGARRVDPRPREKYFCYPCQRWISDGSNRCPLCGLEARFMNAECRSCGMWFHSGRSCPECSTALRPALGRIEEPCPDCGRKIFARRFGASYDLWSLTLYMAEDHETEHCCRARERRFRREEAQDSPRSSEDDRDPWYDITVSGGSPGGGKRR